MRWILFMASGLACLNGVYTLQNATTIFQQIVGCMSFISSAILFSGAAIVDAVVSLKKEICKITDPAEELAKSKEEIIAANNQFLSDKISEKEERCSRTLGTGQM